MIFGATDISLVPYFASGAALLSMQPKPGEGFLDMEVRIKAAVEKNKAAAKDFPLFKDEKDNPLQNEFNGCAPIP